MTKFTEETLLAQLYNLLLEAKLTDNERDVLLRQRNALEQGDYFPKVVKDLKRELAPLAMQQQLSPSVVALLSELKRQYPSDNAWDMLIR